MFSKTILRAGLVLAAGLAFSSFASAQATRTWVSGVGDDANPCSRTAPCKTFAGAISKTATAGEINVLDPGGFGGVTITKSITIDGGGFIASALVSGTNAIVINAPTTSNIVLRNIQLQGLGTGIDGVRFIGGGSLTLDNVVIQQFGGANGDGVDFAPTAAAASTATLTITNSRMVLNGSATGFGVAIRPGANVVVDAMLDGVTINQNKGSGLRIEGASNVTVRNSNVSNNASHGVLVGASALVMVDNVTITNNGFSGVRTDGAGGGAVRVANSTITGNTQGVDPAASQIFSFVNNRLSGNSTDGLFSGNIGQQ